MVSDHDYRRSISLAQARGFCRDLETGHIENLLSGHARTASCQRGRVRPRVRRERHDAARVDREGRAPGSIHRAGVGGPGHRGSREEVTGGRRATGTLSGDGPGRARCLEIARWSRHRVVQGPGRQHAEHHAVLTAPSTSGGGGQWHPGATDPDVDYSSEPMTLVEFHLDDANGGTILRIVESGFDRIPAARRDEAFRMNDGGWTEQTQNIERHVTQP